MREFLFQRQRYRAILAYTGMVLALVGALFFAPIAALPFYPAEMDEAMAFLFPGLILLISGTLTWKLWIPEKGFSLTIQEGGIIVVLGWVITVVFSAFPLMGLVGLDFTRAVFEAVSGWTTTGLSVVDVSKASHLVLLWRSIMQLAGGAGLAIIMMSALIGPVGIGVSAAEGRSDQLAPHVRRSARLVLLIYGGYAIVGTIAYMAVGMDLFDAINHSFAAVSTGGFSTRPESIGAWDSVAVEAVSLPLMIMGNLSFVTAWLLLRGKFRFVLRNGEVRLFSLLAPFSALAVFLFTTQKLYPHLGKAIRVAVFETVSALTTTGFSTVPYSNWNGFGLFILILLMLVGGGTCSTAGGIKQYRVFLLWKSIGWELRRALAPATVMQQRPLWENESRIFVDDERVRQVGVFLFLYLVTYVIGSAILCLSGFSLQDSLFEFASALGTVGLSVGVTSINAPDLAIWSETVAMLLGRLEFIVIFVSIVKLLRDGRVLLFHR